VNEGLCALVGFVFVPLAVSSLFLWVRNLLNPPGLSPMPGTQRSSDVQGAVGLAVVIGAFIIVPLAINAGQALGAAIDRSPAPAPVKERKRLRLRLWLLFGPSLVASLAYLVSAIARAVG
jgi:hypothetical protein